MKFRIPVLSALLLSSPLHADTYYTITGASTFSWEGEYSANLHSYANYYFDGIESKGPRDYFGINTRSNFIGAGIRYYDFDYYKASAIIVGGEYNIGNLQIRAALSNGKVYDKQIDDYLNNSNTSISLQYFFNENWSLGLQDSDTNLENSSIWVDTISNHFDSWFVRYKTELNRNHSLGFTLHYFDVAGAIRLQADHFASLSDGRYLKTQLVVADDGDSSADIKYYFNRNTSIDTTLVDFEIYGIGASHFISKSTKLVFGLSNLQGEESIFDFKITGYF